MPNHCGKNECLDKLSHLPPNGSRFFRYEQLGLRVRSFVRLDIHDRLDPLKLAETVGLKVITLDSVEGLSDEIKNVLKDPSQNWSGGTTPELPDGSCLVVLNPWQSAERQAVTLMEEICHVLLGHKHSQIALATDLVSGNHRDYNDAVEEEAYSVGAAALVPYRSLACDISRGFSMRAIARHFGVSVSLVKYRVRVLQLTANFAHTLGT